MWRGRDRRFPEMVRGKPVALGVVRRTALGSGPSLRRPARQRYPGSNPGYRRSHFHRVRTTAVPRRSNVLDVTTLVGGNPGLEVLASQYQEGRSLQVDQLCPHANGPGEPGVLPKPRPIRSACREEIPIRLQIQIGRGLRDSGNIRKKEK